MGQTFDQAVIARVDQGLGLLLRLPTEPESAVGFCHISNLADGQLGKGEIEKRFKVGGLVKSRVIGFRLVDALVAMSLKESVLAQQVRFGAGFSGSRIFRVSSFADDLRTMARLRQLCSAVSAAACNRSAFGNTLCVAMFPAATYPMYWHALTLKSLAH
jgi:hypothetical protein